MMPSQSDYAKQSIAGQASRNAADAPTPTAAQEALSAVENLNQALREMDSRVEAMCQRLGCSVPSAQSASEKLKPVRGGIIGSIAEAAECGRTIASFIHEQLNRLERQI